MIYDETIRWIGVCEGGEVAEEGVFAIVVLEYIACYACLDEDREDERMHRDALEDVWVMVVVRFEGYCSSFPVPLQLVETY